MRPLIRILIIAVVVLGLAGAGAAWYMQRDSASAAFQTAPVKRGELRAVIGATGTVEPEEVIDVGAQVAGRIDTFGTDPAGKVIDYGSEVEQGTVLANIDQSLYAADVASATAAMETAKANVQKAKADLVQMQAKLGQAQADWERAQKVGPSEALAQSNYDAYKYGYQTAQANVGVAEASVAAAEKGVGQAQATLDRAQKNLGYCTIVSPVKGVIIDRRVNIGQTVVASLNAPSLFLIAKDLKKMQVWASVNEADIGNIRPGQEATFTVDAFPDRTFKGTVGKVRLNATMTQNVVTYTVEINADNSEGTLLPYLTANVSFQVAKHEDVLMVPNAALRWSPSQPEQIVPEARNSAGAGRGKRQQGGPQASEGEGTQAAAPTENAGPTTAPTKAAKSGNRSGNRSGAASVEHRRGTVWIQQGEFVKPIRVRLGLTDGTNTEIQPTSGDELKEGTPVVIAEVRQQASSSSSTSGGAEKNPFAPQMPKKSRGGR